MGSPPSDTGRSLLFKPRRQVFADGYYSYRKGALTLKIAGDYFNERLQDRGDLMPPYYETAFDAWFTTIRYSVRGDLNASLWRSHFLTIRWDPLKVLSFQPGIRAIYNTKYSAPLVYAVSARWTILSPLSLRLSWSKGFRAPSVKELYLNFTDVNHDIRGNPDLKAETGNNLNLYLNFTRENRKTAWTAGISGFYNAIRNIITLAQAPGATSDLSYTYVNLDRYKTTGGQADLSFSFYPALKVSAGVALTGIRVDMDNGVSTGGFSFSTDVVANASYRFGKPALTVGLMYKYNGKRITPYLNGDSLSFSTVSGYNTMDVTVTKEFWKNRIRLSGGIKNLFNNQIIPSTGLGGGAHGGGGGDGVAVGYGRTLFLRLTVQFTKSQ